VKVYAKPAHSHSATACQTGDRQRADNHLYEDTGIGTPLIIDQLWGNHQANTRASPTAMKAGLGLAMVTVWCVDESGDMGQRPSQSGVPASGRTSPESAKSTRRRRPMPPAFLRHVLIVETETICRFLSSSRNLELSVRSPTCGHRACPIVNLDDSVILVLFESICPICTI